MNDVPVQIFQVGSGLGIFAVMLTLSRAAYQAWRDSMVDLRVENERLRRENLHLRKELYGEDYDGS